MTFSEVRKAALAIEVVEEGTSYGTPAFKTGGALFVRYRPDLDSIVVAMDIEEREAAIQDDPETYYVTDHYLNYPWIPGSSAHDSKDRASRSSDERQEVRRNEETSKEKELLSGVTMTDPTCIDLSKTCLQLKPSGKTKSCVSKEFWEAVKTGKGVDSPFGFLVARYDFSSDWNHWEYHPNGDELLIATDGGLQLLLEVDGKERAISLEAPYAFLIPAGTWHTAKLPHLSSPLAIRSP